MIALIRPFWQICLLRSGPQTLPASTLLAALVTSGYLLSGVALLMGEMSLYRSLIQVVIDTLLQGLLILLLLSVRSCRARWLQSYSAMIGAGTLLQLIALPLVLILLSTPEGGVRLLAEFLWLILFGWSMVVSASIYSHSLDLPLPAGIVVALFNLMVIVELTRMIEPLALIDG